MKTTFLSVLLLAGAVFCLRADPVIEFDDLSSSLTQVPSGYHLLKYTNVFLMDGNTYPFNPSGFQDGIMSGNNVIYGGGGTTSVIAGDLFDFLIAFATPAFNDNLQLEAKGYIHGTLVYDQTNSLIATVPLPIVYNFYGVDEVDLTSSGGTQYPGYSMSGTQFVMDDVAVTTYLPYFPPLFTNGGFETGDFSGWTYGGNGNPVTTNAIYVHSGSYGVQIGAVETTNILIQTIPTQMQHEYQVDFWLENESSGSNSFNLTIDGVPEFAITNASAFGWTHYVTDFVASRPSANVDFQFVNDFSYWGFDDFNVTDISSQLENGGFETGDLSGWGETGNTNDIGVGAVHWTGSYGAYFGPSGSPGYISQQLPTSTGQPYLVSLWLENPGGGTPNEYHASWGGQSLADQTNLPAFGWTNLHYTVVAGSSQNILKLGARNDQNFFYLDEVNYWPVPLVQNGSFELGDFSDWTFGGNFENSFVSTNYLYANDGFYGAQLGPQGSLGYLSQTLPTVPGQSYLIHFELDVPQPMTNAEFNVSWNGIVLMDITNTFLHAYVPYEFVVPATSKNATLQFGFRDDSSFLGLDNVSVTAIPSPTIVWITKTNSSADLSVNVMPDFLYQAQYTTNLSQPNWIPVGNLISPTNFPMVLIDTNAADNQRFYRVLLKPPPLSF